MNRLTIIVRRNITPSATSLGFALTVGPLFSQRVQYRFHPAALSLPLPLRSLLRPRLFGSARRRHVIPRQPAAETIEAGEQHALVDVGLIEVVPYFPLELRRDADLATEPGMLLEPFVEVRGRARHQGEQ